MVIALNLYLIGWVVATITMCGILVFYEGPPRSPKDLVLVLLLIGLGAVWPVILVMYRREIFQ